MARWLSWLERRPVTAEVEGSSPFRVVRIVRYKKSYGIIAQLGEHLPYKQRVIGSSPIGPIEIRGGFPSGQRGQTVNLLAPPSKVRILLHPYFSFAAVAEQADAQDLKSCGTYTPVPVRFRSAAVKKFLTMCIGFVII